MLKNQILLEPCPFCGERDELTTGGDWSWEDGYVKCKKCNVTMKSHDVMHAIMKWNIRPLRNR